MAKTVLFVILVLGVAAAEARLLVQPASTITQKL